jgi:hypothetical protein
MSPPANKGRASSCHTERKKTKREYRGVDILAVLTDGKKLPRRLTTKGDIKCGILKIFFTIQELESGPALAFSSSFACTFFLKNNTDPFPLYIVLQRCRYYSSKCLLVVFSQCCGSALVMRIQGAKQMLIRI